MQVLVRTASAPNLEDDGALDDLVRTDGWLTLMTFARESARKSSVEDPLELRRIVNFCSLTANRPSNAQLPSEHTPMDMDDDIPPELYDQIARESGSGGGSGGGSSNIRICPHCTFENTHGGSDCEICSLPL